MKRTKQKKYRGKQASDGHDWMFTNFKYALKLKKVRNKDNKKENCKAYKILDSLAMTSILVYNQALDYCQEFYKNFKQLPSNTQIDQKIREYASKEENKQYFCYMPAQSLQQVRDHIRKAYKAFHERMAEVKKFKRKIKNKKGKLKFLPKFKSICRSRFSICYPQRKSENRGGWDFGNRNKTCLILPKLLEDSSELNSAGKPKQIPIKIPFIKHKNMTGEPVSITFTKDVDRWYVTFTTRKQVPTSEFSNNQDISSIPLNKIGGLDVGVVHLGTLEDSSTIESVNYEELEFKIKSLQKKLARQFYKKEECENEKTGKKYYKIISSKSREATKLHLRKTWRRLRNKRHNDLLNHANTLLKKYNVLFVEDLKIQNMSRSAKGTKEKQGKNVKAKTGLNRSIRAKCWGQLFRILEYKFRRARKIFERVPAKHTSRKCSKCGYVHKNNRPTQEHFKCLAVNCSNEMNADHNAAINIRNKGILLYMSSELKRFKLEKLQFSTNKYGEHKKLKVSKLEFSKAS